MRAIGYIRVSTLEQVKEGYGLEAQEQAIREYCDRQGLELIRIFRDEGTSGASGEAVRPGLASILAALEDGEAEALVVKSLDRLARDLLLQETIIARLAKRGVSTVSVNGGDHSEDDAERVLFRQMMGAFSQYERALIKARLAAGKAVKRESGGYVGGRPPFGFRVEDGMLVEDEGEQHVLKMIRAYRREGLSLRGIANRLNEAGILTKSGLAWNTKSVHRVTKRLEDAPA